jgi:hypothetical protein
LTPGQAAFEKWNSLVPLTNRVYITWEQYPEAAKQGWEEIAQAATNQYIGNAEMTRLMADKLIIGKNTGQLRGFLNSDE